MYDKKQFPSEDDKVRLERDEEREWLYQEWCKERTLDPEDIGSMMDYEEWYGWEHGVSEDGGTCDAGSPSGQS